MSYVTKDQGAVDTLIVANNGTIGGDLTVYGTITSSVTTGITANTDQNQTNATVLTSAYNIVTTSATHGDSVLLPAASAGRPIAVINDGAKDVAVFPASGDAIESLGANTQYYLASGSRQVFVPKDSTTYLTLNRGTRYVSRGALSAYDITDLENDDDNDWKEFDMSAIIPPSAYGKLVRVRVGMIGGATGQMDFRQKGLSNSINGYGVGYWNNAQEAAGVEILCDSAGAVEYKLSATVTSGSIAVNGWRVEG